MCQIVLFTIRVHDLWPHDYKHILMDQPDEQDFIISHLEIYISQDMVMREQQQYHERI